MLLSPRAVEDRCNFQNWACSPSIGSTGCDEQKEINSHFHSLSVFRVRLLVAKPCARQRCR